MPTLEAPKTGDWRPVADLAVPSNATPATVYQGVHRGHIGGTKRVGKSIKINGGAFEYHSRLGWGRHMPAYGTAGWREYAAEHATDEASAAATAEA
jgi:hypothetical protein